MMKSFLFILLACVTLSSYAQEVEKVWFDEKDTTYGFYSVLKPASGRIQAVLVLMDGYSGNGGGMLRETKLHYVASANDILTVCVPTGLRLYADSSIITLLNRTLQQIIQTYHVKKDRFVLGGFSSGGTIVLRYAELCRERPKDYPIEPAAVFTGDSPVDLLGLYNSSKKDLRINYPGAWWLYESNMIVERLDKEIGKPLPNLDNYKKISPFLEADTATGNEKWLKDVPYRTYHDVDVAWYIQNRKRSLYQTNMLNASELVNRLVLLGNKNADFISSAIRGKRYNGDRHPHVWSIIDEVEAVQWMKQQLHFFPEHIKTPFVYKAPDNWQPEIILFPIDFAAGLPYEGFEELRFAPGWGNSGSNEKWAYTILWWLNGQYPFDAKTLAHDLEVYFSGLTKRRAIADSLDMSAYHPAKAEVQKIKTDSNDMATYSATVSIFDSQVTRKPGTLYAKIHQKKCEDASKTILLFEFAGNPIGSPVWQQLDSINGNFRCSSK